MAGGVIEKRAMPLTKQSHTRADQPTGTPCLHETSGETGPTCSVAIIGVSGYAKSVFSSLCAVLGGSGARLVAATVINRHDESAACDQICQLGGSVFSDYNEMLDAFQGRLDLCIIPTSIHWHAPMVLAALKAGANVLVEKPLAGSTEEARAIVAGAASAGRFVAVAFQDMYAPETWAIKRFLSDRELGGVKSIQVSGSWPRGRDYYGRNRWAGRLHCDGRPVFDSPLNNAFAHFINLALFFAAGEVQRLERIKSVEGRLLRHYPIENYDTAAVCLATENGVRVDAVFTHADPAGENPRLVVEMDRGKLVWIYDHSVSATDPEGRVVKEWSVDLIEAKRQAMMKNVIGCTFSRERPLFTADLALNHVEAVEKVQTALPIADATEGMKKEGANGNGTEPWSPVEGLFSGLLETRRLFDAQPHVA